MLSTATVYPDGSIKLSTLGLSNAPIYHNTPKTTSTVERSPKGLKGISPEARRRLRSAVKLLQDIYKKKNLSFLTCTIPTLEIDHHYQVLENWDEIVRKFNQELSRLLIRYGLPNLKVCVTELQEKRTLETGLIAPHLHIVFVGRENKYQDWFISKEEIQALWQRILTNHLGFEPDCKAATNIQGIKKDVKRYLSKYLSKGGTILETLKAAGLQQWIPRCWYSCSRELSKLVQESLITLDQVTSEYIYDNREYLKSVGILNWFYVIVLELPDYKTGFVYTKNAGMVAGFNDKIPIADILTRINNLMVAA